MDIDIKLSPEQIQTVIDGGRVIVHGDGWYAKVTARHDSLTNDPRFVRFVTDIIRTQHGN